MSISLQMSLPVRCATLIRLFAIVIFLSGCEKPDEDLRAKLAAMGEGPIRVALVWDKTREDGFLKGANLARDKLNSEAKILRRPLEFIEFDDSFVSDDRNRRGVDIGREIASDPSVVAAIGHSSTATALPASIIYEKAGILFLNPAITDRSLNEHGFKYTFSTIPNNERIGSQIATQAFSRGFRRVAILNSRSDEAFEITEAFAKQAAALGMHIVSRQSFFDQRENFRDVIAGFGQSGFDALFLAANPMNTRAIISQGMEMHFKKPFLLGGLADPIPLQQDLGNDTPLLIMPILFNPYARASRIHSFLSDFKDIQDTPPDGWSAQGYDAVMLLAEAMNKAKSSVPLSVATIIRYTLSWQGITGRHSFTQAGNIYAKTLDFATLESGKVQFRSAEGEVFTFVDNQETSAFQ